MSSLHGDIECIENALIDAKKDVFEAWQRVKATAVSAQPMTPCPPCGNEGVGGSLTNLENHLHKMAALGQRPLPNSHGLEVLLFRLVKANEETAAMIAQTIEEARGK